MTKVEEALAQMEGMLAKPRRVTVTGEDMRAYIVRDIAKNMPAVEPAMAEEFADALLGILDHVEAQERDACAKIVVLGFKEGWTHMQIVDEIRARGKE